MKNYRRWKMVMPVKADAVEHAYSFDEDSLNRALLDADLPSLIPALAYLTGELTILRPEFRANATRNVIGALPQGGMSSEVQAAAREAAVAALLAWDRAGSPGPREWDQDGLHSIVEFVTGPIDGSILPLVHNQLGIVMPLQGSQGRQSAVARREFSAIVIGAGMSGLAAAYQLKREGIPFTVFERHSQTGGVWTENTYPGVRLDTSNFCYSYSFAQRAGWQHYYSPGAEVARYLTGVSHQAELRDSIRFNTEVQSAEYDELRDMWSVTVVDSSGHETKHTANVLISAAGQLNTAKYPDIPGAGSFQGSAWHTAKWNHDVSLAGKRVAVIGTGASSFQVISAIAPEVEGLTVFQRTPPWVVPTPNYQKKLTSGLYWLFEVLPFYERWYRFVQFWANVEGRRKYAIVDPTWDRAGSVSSENLALRAALEETVREAFSDRPDLVRKMMPDYPPYAKRMLRDDGAWARALRSDHVEVVDDPIESIVPSGVRTASGRVHEVDVIIYGTGFDASKFVSTFEVKGKGGLTLREQWAEDARAYAGITVPNFPNLFLLYGPNTNLVVNGSIVLFTEAEVDYVVSCLRLLLEQDLRAIEPTETALEAYYERLDEASSGMAYGLEGVSNWYKSASGRVTQNWPLTTLEFWEMTRAPDLDAYTVW